MSEREEGYELRLRRENAEMRATLERIQRLAEGNPVEAEAEEHPAMAAVRALCDEQAQDYADAHEYRMQLLTAQRAARQPFDTLEAQLADFHRLIGEPVGEFPAVRTPELRAALILEEAVETVIAIITARVHHPIAVKNHVAQMFKKLLADTLVPSPDNAFAHAIDGICDTHYVLLGTAVAFGVKLQPFFDEVHYANMQKGDGPIREDGKRMKPEGWRPPNIEGILQRQLRRKVER